MTSENRDLNYKQWAQKRAERGEVVGGGFIIMRRSPKNGRIKQNNRQRQDGSVYAADPFEHPTYEAAFAEAQKLADRYPHGEFAVFEQRGSVKGEGMVAVTVDIEMSAE